MPLPHQRLLDQLGQLIATPSVSSTDPHWDQGNRPVIELLAAWAADLGFCTEISDDKFVISCLSFSDLTHINRGIHSFLYLL